MSIAPEKKPMRVSLRSGALALFLFALSGCVSQTQHEPRWAQSEVNAASYRVLWEFTLLALNKHGFPNSSRIDPNSLVAESGWSTHLLPFKGAGYRARAVVELERLEPERWSVRVRVRRQFNEAIANTLDQTYAEWEWGEDDEVEAALLLQTIRSYAGVDDPWADDVQEAALDR